MGRHFVTPIADHHFDFRHDAEKVVRKRASMDLYAIRTSIPSEQLDAGQTV